jgi:glutamate-1-semialdehyde aminotransferase
LQWYRAKLAEQKKQRAKAAAATRGVRAKKRAEVREAMRVYRRATFEQVRIQRAREAGTLTKDMIRREEALYEQFIEAERKLETIMSAAEYERFTLRYDRFLEAERRRRKRRYG